MARNGTGTYTKVNTFVSGTSITASSHNANWDDAAAEITNSVAADGQTPITGALKGANGSFSAPSYSFASDPNTGVYRIGSDNLGLTAGGTLVVAVAATGITITGTFTPSGQMLPADGTVLLPEYSFGSDPDSGLYRIGANNVGIAVNAAKVLDISATGLNVIGAVQSNGATLAPISASANMVNGTIVASVSANALTVAIKTLSGADPSSGNPVFVNFRNATNATGDYVTLSLTAATSIVVSSGSTLGTLSSNIGFRLWLVGFNDASTFRLGIINCATAAQIFPLNEETVKSSTAEGGAGAADSAGVFYTGTAVSSKAFRILGSLDFSVGQATAGAWATAPDVIELFGPGVKKPGDVVQSLMMTTVTTTNNATSTYATSAVTQAMTPTSACNMVKVFISAGATCSNTGVCTSQIQRGAVAVGSPVFVGNAANGIDSYGISLVGLDAPNTASSVTYAAYFKSSTATQTFNGGTIILDEVKT